MCGESGGLADGRNERRDNQLDEANESVMMKERGGGCGAKRRGCCVEKC